MAASSRNGLIQMAAASDIGTVRKQNEDYFYFSKHHQFFIVCDGMGGHRSGAIASRIAGETLRDVLSDEVPLDCARACEDVEEDLPLPVLKLVAGVRLANRRILLEGARNPKMHGMGSTLVAAIVHKGWLFTVNVGDSRIYRLREARLATLTKDHSWLNELLEDEEINESEVQQFKKKNVLTRALGTYPTVKIDLRIENVETGDLYLLCSDGLHNALSDDLIESILSAEHPSMQKMVEKLISSAKSLNGSDNITGGVFQICGQMPRTLAPTLYEKTILDESRKVTQYLDRIVKSHYPQDRRKKDFPSKWLALAGIAVVLLSLTSAFLYKSGKSAKLMESSLSSALLTQELSALEQTANGRPAKRGHAGTVLLLQVKDERYIDLLRRLQGVRVLDTVARFSGAVPVYSGRFTWAMADSAQRIIYQKRNIQLKSLRRWNREAYAISSRENEQNITVSSRAAASSSSLSKKRSTVYLVGAFNSSIYEDASIYIDEARLGLLNEYLESGFYLRPGTYVISIRDQRGKILKSKENQVVHGGEIIAVEF